MSRSGDTWTVNRGKPELAAKLYQEGMSISQLAKKIGVDRTTIFRWLDQMGVERRPAGAVAKEKCDYGHSREEYATYNYIEKRWVCRPCKARRERERKARG